MALRAEFPPAGTEYMGGTSDGWEYQTVFAGSNLEASYEMVRQFLREEGYEDVPLPANTADLLRFRLATRNKQILLFEDNGYIHNPIKILFPADCRKKRVLILRVYNEQIPQHLLRFHRVLDEK